MDPYLIIHFSYDILCYSINHSQYILIGWPRIYNLFPCQFACHFFRYPTLSRGLEVVLLLFQLQHRRLTCRLWLFNRWFSHENQMIFPWKPDDFPMKTFIYKREASNHNTSGIQKSCSIARKKRQFLTPEVSRAGSPRWFGPGFGTRKILRKSNIPAWENQASLSFTDFHRCSPIFSKLADFSPSKVSLMCP
jgi:hypothetical protein